MPLSLSKSQSTWFCRNFFINSEAFGFFVPIRQWFITCFLYARLWLTLSKWLIYQVFSWSPSNFLSLVNVWSTSYFIVLNISVRSAKFISRKQWIVAGSDDMFIRVYNYNTMDKVKVFEAHTDYIRCVAVHPTLPYVLSSSDDMLIKLWDWDKGWLCTQIFEGHSHYVMQVTFNPKDTNTFASASLDRTIKVFQFLFVFESEMSCTFDFFYCCRLYM